LGRSKTFSGARRKFGLTQGAKLRRQMSIAAHHKTARRPPKLCFSQKNEEEAPEVGALKRSF